MPTYFALINVLFVALVVGTVVGLMVWAIATQHRDPGAAHLRLRRWRLQLTRTPLPADQLEGPAQKVVLG